MRRPIAIAILVLLLGLTSGSALAASEAPRVLGADGTIFTLLQGSYGEIFPQGNLDEELNAVLALEIRRPQAAPEILPVPATFGPGQEFSPILVMDRATSAVFLLWQSWTSLTQSQFLITSYDAGSWSEVIEITGTPFSWKSTPRFSVTHDSFDCLARGCDAESAVSRTIIHLVWQQDSERGAPVTIYAPLILEDGRYIGEHPEIILNDLLPEAAVGATPVLAQVEPEVQPGRDDGRVVVGFLDGANGRLGSVEIRVLPGELSDLGNELRVSVEEAGQGKDLSDEESLNSVIEHARHQLIDVGVRMEPEILSRLLTATESFLLETGDGEGGVERIAGDARHQLIDVGARITEGRLMRVDGKARHQLIDVGVHGGYVGGGGQPEREHQHDLLVRPVHSDQLPELTAETFDLFLSSSGEGLLIAWHDDQVVQYRETSGNGWSQVFELRLSERLSLESAHAILGQRMSGR